MATLKVDLAGCSDTKQKALEDAKNTQLSILRECAEAGRDPPPYLLSELIGKGSFGRVYKATDTGSQRLVAVKIISIEEGDALHPGAADTLKDILKEVDMLKLLSHRNAKNINLVLDTILIGASMWIITEYCGGGSVATLMRPTGGLAEKWIIPILREVAEAVFWVHKQGIIHRDLKCANILVTEAGAIQLCDFGVAGIMETKFDKRSTVTGTLQWMAPELFDSAVSYGTEVDIWAFGSIAYEVATGFPPNATTFIDITQFGSYLKQNCPRLEGDHFSAQLRDLVSFCMVQDPAQRPRIEQVQKHPYVANTASTYPSSSLSRLVSAYHLWELQGGNRRSLFSAGGAQGSVTAHEDAVEDEWNFDAVDEDGQLVDEFDAQAAVYDAYGPRVSFPPRTSASQPRRRRPPPNIKPFTAPIERIFDPYTLTNYHDNARAFYYRQTSAPSNDLPLRDDSQHPTVRESLIDLDTAVTGVQASGSPDMETIRPKGRPLSSDLSDLHRRRTQDWTFPMMSAGSVSLDIATIQSRSDSPPPSSDASDSCSDDLLAVQSSTYSPTAARLNRASALSLIDLDAGLPPDITDNSRPSTAGSYGISSGSDIATTPFDLEIHTLDHRLTSSATRLPFLYISDDFELSREPPAFLSAEFLSPPREEVDQAHVRQNNSAAKRMLPPLPAPPSTNVMQGLGTPEELRQELKRLVSSLNEHLQYARGTMEAMWVRPA